VRAGFPRACPHQRGRYAIRRDGGPPVSFAELRVLVDDLLDTDGGGTR
jgi:hypothetical protein